MEDALGVAARPPDPARPPARFDAGGEEVRGEVRPPLPAIPGHPLCSDTAYERHGTATPFLGCAPPLGKRGATVTAQRTRLAFAHAIRDLVAVRFPAAERIVLVLDNLNTHDPASLCLAHPPAEARRRWDRLEVRPTPKHGGWRNVAEIELSVLGRRCLDRRIPDQATLATEVAAWVAARNAERVTVKWPFTTADARTKLKHRYPVPQPAKRKRSESEAACRSAPTSCVWI
jgi:hypothetical protein